MLTWNKEIVLASLTLYTLSSFQDLNSEDCGAILTLNLALSFIVCLQECFSLSSTVDIFPLW